MTRRIGWSSLLLAAALTVTAAGCGSEDTADEAAAPSTPADDAPTVTDAPAVTDAPDSAPAGTDAPASSDDVDTTIDPAAEPDLCATLTTADLDGLLAEPAGPPELETDDFGGTCTVAAADGESRGTVVLRVSDNAATANYENAREQFGVDAEIAGLGDSAFASGPMVIVLDGDRLVSLQAIRWAELGADGADQADLEAAVGEVLAALADPTAGAPAPAGEGLACTLLADIDVEGLIGEPVGPPVDESDGSQEECVIEPENADSTAYSSLTITSSEAADEFAETREVLGEDSTVAGLGDEAFHSGPVLAVLDGDQAVVLWIMGDIMLGANIDDADMEAAMTQVLAGLAGS